MSDDLLDQYYRKIGGDLIRGDMRVVKGVALHPVTWMDIVADGEDNPVVNAYPPYTLDGWPVITGWHIPEDTIRPVLEGYLSYYVVPTDKELSSQGKGLWPGMTVLRKIREAHVDPPVHPSKYVHDTTDDQWRSRTQPLNRKPSPQ